MLVLRSTRVVLPDGVEPAAIRIDNGTITRIEIARLKGSRSLAVEATDAAGRSASLSGERDLGDLVIAPGLVDTHVHVNEPGRTEWEGFDTATRAAAAGGVTTIVDMPLNSVPATTTVAALEAKRSAARGRVHVDVAFWGGVVPGNAGELDALVDAGVRGFKCFLAPSGVAEFPHVDERDLRAVLPILARRRVPLLVHAELPRFLGSPERLALHPSTGAYATYLSTRPPRAELEAVEMLIGLAREFAAHVHVVHVACAEAVDAIARAKAEGVSITAETCPHYLTFTAGDVADGATEFKCAPPIREAPHRDALWAGLQSGALDLVATDHSPAPPAMKCSGDFMTAWGGIASLELSLAATHTALDGARAFQASDPLPSSDRSPERLALHARLALLARWMSAAPAALARLADRKGRIAEGYDADLVVWDPDAEWTVEPSRLQQRHKLSPYAGRTLRGAVCETYLRGQRVWGRGALDQPCAGTLL